MQTCTEPPSEHPLGSAALGAPQQPPALPGAGALTAAAGVFKLSVGVGAAQPGNFQHPVKGQRAAFPGAAASS